MCDVVVLVSVGLLAYLVGRMDRGQSEAMYGVSTNAYVWECDYASVDVDANVNVHGHDNVNANVIDSVYVYGYDGSVSIVPKAELGNGLENQKQNFRPSRRIEIEN